MNLSLLKGEYIEEMYKYPSSGSFSKNPTLLGCDREGPQGLLLPRDQSESRSGVLGCRCWDGRQTAAREASEGWAARRSRSVSSLCCLQERAPQWQMSQFGGYGVGVSAVGSAPKVPNADS